MSCRFVMLLCLAGLVAGAVYAQGAVLFEENFDAPGVRWQGSAVPGAGGMLVHAGTDASSHLIVPVQLPAEFGRIKVAVSVSLGKGQFGFGFAPRAKIDDKTMKNPGQPWMNIFGVNSGAVYAGPYATERVGELAKHKLKINGLQMLTFELIRNGTVWTYRVSSDEKLLAEGPITVDPEKLKYFFVQFREDDEGTHKNESVVDSIRLETDSAEPVIVG